MKKINKIINTAVIFMIIVMFFVTEFSHASSFCLRPPLAFSESQKNHKNTSGLKEMVVDGMEGAELKFILDKIIKGERELRSNMDPMDKNAERIISTNHVLLQRFAEIVDNYSLSEGMLPQVLDETVDLLERYSGGIKILTERENPVPDTGRGFGVALKSYVQLIKTNLSILKELREIAREMVLTGIPLLRREFAEYIKRGISIKTLDVGSGVSQPFLYRLKRVLSENKIKAEIYGVEPKATRDDVERAGHEEITLMPGFVEYLADKDSERHKYQVIFINAPDFIRVKEFVETMDYLLSEDGIIIFRSGKGERSDFERSFRETLDKKYSGKWMVIRIDNKMRDLPEGYFVLDAPLLIKRVNSVNRRLVEEKSTGDALKRSL
jgi:hypothetical protein